MPLITIAFGLLLVLQGITFFGYYLTPTALIPAIFGIALIALGFWARSGAVKLGMHLAVLVGLLGILGGLGMGLPGLLKVMNEEDGTRPVAVVSQLLLGAICLVYVVLCVKSFIAARKKPAEQD